MTNTIQSPGRGRALRAAWGADVADMLNRHERELAAGVAAPWVNRRGGAGRLAPFTVRWSEADGSLVVYLPQGSCSLLGYTVLNVAAADADWYKVHYGAQRLSAAGEVTVTAHVKGRFQVGSGEIHPAVYMDATSSSASNNLYGRAGDVWAMDVATVTVTEETVDGATSYARAVEQRWSGPVDWLSAPAPGILELHWWLSSAFTSFTDAPDFRPCFQAAATDRAPVCDVAFGSSAYTVSLTRGTSLSKVYYVIDLTGSAPVPSVTMTAPTADLDKKLVYWIYSLQHGRVMADRRAILAERVFYP